MRATAPGPGSLTWSLFRDVRGLLLAPAVLVLQVAHPVVGAGVCDHSGFVRAPWPRLMRTIGATIRFTYGDDVTAGAEASRLRELHRGITGTDGAGRPYHALEPAAYAWVHLTLAQCAADVRAMLSAPLTAGECARFYAEWREVGRRLGVAEAEMPSDWPGFRRYFEAMVADVLEDNAAVRDVLAVVTDPPPPPGVPRAAWAPVAVRAGRLHRLFTVGHLPPRFRDRLGLGWTDGDAARLARATGVVRALDAVPEPLRTFPTIHRHALAARWWLPPPRALAARG